MNSESAAGKPSTTGVSPAPSFIRALIANVVGLVIVLELVLLAAMIWRAVDGTEQTLRRDVGQAVDRAEERLRILARAAEMTAESAERAARGPQVNSGNLRSALELSLAALEQRPELSYLGIVLPDSGEYGNLERTASGEILLWSFPGNRRIDPVTHNFLLTDKGFVRHGQWPADGYDPRDRPFYRAALDAPGGETWLTSYRWIVHFSDAAPLWGISYVKALRDDNGRLFAVLDADIDLPALNRFLKSLADEYRSEFQIVELGAKPRLIGDPKVGREPLPLPRELEPLLEFTGDIWIERMMLDGRQRWLAARRLTLKGGISCMVVAIRDAPLIEAGLVRQLYEVFAMGLLIALALWWISLRMARRFGRPLAELEQRVAGIGRYDQATPAMSSACDANQFRETQLLGEALDRMSLAVNQLLDAKEQQAASLALKGAIFDSSHTAIFSLDHALNIIEWNTAAERLFGLDRQQVLGRTAVSTLQTPDGTADWAGILQTKAVAALSFIGAQGAFDAELRVAAFKRNQQEVFTCFINDVSERKRADAALRESLARFDPAAQATRDAVWDWDLLFGTLWWSENFQILFGYGEDEIAPTIGFWAERIHPEDRDRLVEHLHEVVAGKEDIWSDEYRFLCKCGSYADVFDRGKVLRDQNGRGLRMIGAVQDITARKRAEQHVRFLASHDALTGLPNRNLVLDRIEQAISHAKRSGQLLAMLYLDLDRFKLVNDGYGHCFGDTVLQATARRLQQLVREGDTVSRQGGDEFLILLTDLHSAVDAYNVARKVVEHLDQPLDIEQRRVHLSGSIGISVFPQDGDSAELLIANADMAMYRAKELGRNTCQPFSCEMSEATKRRVELENSLRSAVVEDQLLLQYQPKVCLKSGLITGCEALLRWNHPERGMIPPTHFIPIAEESGLIVPIGDWVLREACRQTKAWLDAGLPPVCVAVNLSVRQFLQQDVVGWVLNMLAETGLPPALLELELTETLIAQDVDKVAATFFQLRGAGVRLSIDDFGTGYSSLNYLKRLPVDVLKIDQSFVRDMLTDPEDAAIVKAVIALAHNLDFKVIAEGAETERHCQILRQLACDEIQGYCFSKPLAAGDFEALLRNGRQLP